MSGEAAIRSALQDMESDLYDVERFGHLLIHISATPHMLEGNHLDVLAGPLVQAGARLREHFIKAFAAAGGRS